MKFINSVKRDKKQEACKTAQTSFNSEIKSFKRRSWRNLYENMKSKPEGVYLHRVLSKDQSNGGILFLRTDKRYTNKHKETSMELIKAQLSTASFCPSYCYDTFEEQRKINQHYNSTKSNRNNISFPSGIANKESCKIINSIEENTNSKKQLKIIMKQLSGSECESIN